MQNIKDQIVEEFNLFDDPMDKYSYIVDMGRNMTALNPQYRSSEYLVKGCQSKVWLHAYEKDGGIIYEADSNTAITKGIVALLIRVLSNHTAEEILNEDMEFIEEIGLRSHLSSQRSNGLTAMIKEMKLYALAIKQKSDVKEVNS